MKRLLSKVMFVLLLIVVLMGVGVVEAEAAPFTRATIRYDRMMTGKLSSLQVTIVPASVGTETKVKLVFASTVVGTGQSATTTSLPANAIALPGTLTAVGSGTSITVVCSDLTVGTTYAFNLVTTGTGTGVTTPAAGAYLDTVSTLDSGVSTVDSTTVTSRIITNDQVVITGNVPPTFTFTLSGNTDTFTTDLGASAVALTSGISVAVTTNAAKGWTGWVKSSNTALSSATTGETIPTSGTIADAAVSTCTGGADCYLLSVGVTSGTGGGTLTGDADYVGNGTTTGGTFSTLYQPFATRTGKTNGDTIWFKGLASILATKAAGSDYTDTWTIIGAGNF
jgi:hypothetical protein